MRTCLHFATLLLLASAARGQGPVTPLLDPPQGELQMCPDVPNCPEGYEECGDGCYITLPPTSGDPLRPIRQVRNACRMKNDGTLPLLMEQKEIECLASRLNEGASFATPYMFNGRRQQYVSEYDDEDVLADDSPLWKNTPTSPKKPCVKATVVSGNIIQVEDVNCGEEVLPICTILLDLLENEDPATEF